MAYIKKGESLNGNFPASQKYISLVKTFFEKKGEKPKALIKTYGCQGNVSDSEVIRGQLNEMGFLPTLSEEDADVIIFNTCAVRGRAENRVYGNIGALKGLKESKKDMIIGVCGCMTQQKSAREIIKKSYPYVDFVLGSFAMNSLPETLWRVLNEKKRVFDDQDNNVGTNEGLPRLRGDSYKAFLSVMYGCDNFCTYCIVPYVRGRERSREPEAIIKEAKELINSGVKDITLLGQNVNSYGMKSPFKERFFDLIREINSIDGDFWIRFMTSHPKDITRELLDTMAGSEKAARHLHLPLQSGSDDVLKRMGRNYTREKYLATIDYARRVMPDISVTSDIIVGFPGETDDDFEDTLKTVKEADFTSVFMFNYSKREGTPAAKMGNQVPDDVKKERFLRLLKLTEDMAKKRNESYVGKTFKVLTEKAPDGSIRGRTQGNFTIDINDNAEEGKFTLLKVTGAGNRTLYGEEIK